MCQKRQKKAERDRLPTLPPLLFGRKTEKTERKPSSVFGGFNYKTERKPRSVFGGFIGGYGGGGSLADFDRLAEMVKKLPVDRKAQQKFIDRWLKFRREYLDIRETAVPKTGKT